MRGIEKTNNNEWPVNPRAQLLTGEGGRKRGIPAAGRVWQQQGGYSLVGHVPRYRMIHFGGYLTQVEGAGGDTVKNLS